MRALGRYTLLYRLATGTTGEVFVALDGPRAVRVVKIHSAEIGQDATVARLLLAEGASATAIAHPNLVRVRDVGRANGELYAVMDHVPGQTLAAFLQRSAVGGAPLPPRLMAWVGAEIAAGLARLHDTPWAAHAPGGMIHGGVSPRAVQLGYDGVARLLGVGSGRARLARTPARARLAFAAPEVLNGLTPDRRADLFSLGVLLHDGLTGRRLFRRADDDATRAAILAGPPASVRSELAGFGPELAELVTALVSPQPGDRPHGAAEVEAVLRAAVGTAPSAGELGRLLGVAFGEERGAQRRVLEVALRRVGALDDDPATLEPQPHAPSAETPDAEAPTGEGELATARVGRSPPPAAVTDPVLDTTDHDARRTLRMELHDELARALAGDSSVVAPSPLDPPLPKRIARYIVRAALGGDALARYYRGRDPNVGRRVLLKVFDTGPGTGDGRLGHAERVGLLQREARIAGRLRHPRLPVLLDAGRDGDLFFLAYEFVQGAPLRSRLDGGHRRPGAPEVRRWAGELADALLHLHQRGYVHGDVRPDNVVIDADDAAWLLELGLAVEVEGEGEPHPLHRLGRLAAAPELGGDDATATPLADQYALGATLHAALVGAPPGPEGADREAMRRLPIQDRGLEEILWRMTLAAPEARFPDLAAVLAALRATEEAPTLTGVRALVDAAPGPVVAPPPVAERVPESAVPAEAPVAPAELPPSAVVDPLLAEVLLVEPTVTGAVAAVIAALEAPVGVVGSLDAAEAAARQGAARAVVVPEVSESEIGAALARNPALDVRAVAPLLDRLLGAPERRRGPPAEHGTLIELLLRIDGTGAPDVEHEAHVRRVVGVGQRLGLPEAAVQRLELAAAVRMAARRIGRPAQSVPFVETLRLEVQALLAPVDRVFEIPPGTTPPAPLPVQVLAALERYLDETHVAETKVSPRRAVLALRESADEGWVEVPVVEALIAHLRDELSALDVPDRPIQRRRVLLAGVDDEEHRLEATLIDAGLEVESMFGDAMVAWNMVAQGGYDAIVLGPELSTEDVSTLMRLVRSGPRTELMSVVALRPQAKAGVDPEEPATAQLEPEAEPDEVRAALQALLE